MTRMPGEVTSIEDETFNKRVFKIVRLLLEGRDVSKYDVYDIVATTIWMKSTWKIPKA